MLGIMLLIYLTLFEFLNYLILPAALGPGVYSISNRNEYQKHKNNNVSGEQNEWKPAWTTSVVIEEHSSVPAVFLAVVQRPTPRALSRPPQPRASAVLT
jgi:hypothetical protein